MTGSSLRSSVLGSSSLGSSVRVFFLESSLIGLSLEFSVIVSFRVLSGGFFFIAFSVIGSYLESLVIRASLRSSLASLLTQFPQESSLMGPSLRFSVI